MDLILKGMDFLVKIPSVVPPTLSTPCTPPCRSAVHFDSPAKVTLPGVPFVMPTIPNFPETFPEFEVAPASPRPVIDMKQFVADAVPMPVVVASTTPDASIRDASTTPVVDAPTRDAFTTPEDSNIDNSDDSNFDNRDDSEDCDDNNIDDVNDYNDEDLARLPHSEAQEDPLYRVKVQVSIAGRTHFGRVVAIDVGTMSCNYLYLIRYDDGDLEHFTRLEVTNSIVPKM